jgi:hypothetical protein
MRRDLFYVNGRFTWRYWLWRWASFAKAYLRVCVWWEFVRIVLDDPRYPWDWNDRRQKKLDNAKGIR